jgi:hypothetical protein
MRTKRFRIVPLPDLTLDSKNKRKRKTIKVRKVITVPIRSNIPIEGELARKENEKGTAAIENGTYTRKAKGERRNWDSKIFLKFLYTRWLLS